MPQPRNYKGSRETFVVLLKSEKEVKILYCGTLVAYTICTTTVQIWLYACIIHICVQAENIEFHKSLK